MAGIPDENSGGCKRSRPEGFSVPQGKRPKMEHSVNQQCSTLLKTLMKHPASGTVFNQPLNPKALKKNPMDLCTISSKLAKNKYVGLEEFVADIKLMFSNAILCNPLSGNNVHTMAEQVNEFFEERLKYLEKNWNYQENVEVGHGKSSSLPPKVVNTSRKSCPKTLPPRNSSNMPRTRKSKPSEEKVVKVPLNGKETEICGRLTSQSKSYVARSDEAVSALNDENVVLAATSDAASGGRLLTATIIGAPMSPKKALHVAMLKSRFADTILKAQQMIKPVILDHGNNADPVKMPQEKRRLERRKGKRKTKIRAAEGATKKKADVELRRQRKREREAAKIALQKMENTAGVELNLEIFKELEILSGCSLSGGNYLLHQLGLFIKKEYLEDDEEEEEVLMYEEEKAKTIAAAKIKEEVELKRKREREREAARIRLQKMENTAGIELNLEILKELEILSGCSLYGGNPLHQLGLFIKQEYVEDDEEEAVQYEELEEGEIQA